MKSKCQQSTDDQSNDECNINMGNTNKNSQTTLNQNEVKDVLAPGDRSDEALIKVSNTVPAKSKKDEESDRSSTLITGDDSGNNKAKSVYSMKLDMEKFHIDNAENPHADAFAMGNVLKYISECSEQQNKKNKKRKKVISFNPRKENALPNTRESKSDASKDPKLIRKCSKTVTNVSKRGKGKKRNLRNYNASGIDWISFNRNNAGKIQNSSKIKTQLINRENTKNLIANTAARKNNLDKKEIDNQSNQRNKIDYYDTVENKLKKNFFYEDANVRRSNIVNDSLKKSAEKMSVKKKEPERISIRDFPSVKIAKSEENKLKEHDQKTNVIFNRISLNNMRRNELNQNISKNVIRKNVDLEKKEAPRSRVPTSNNKENRKFKLSIAKNIDDNKSVFSNIEIGKTFNMKNRSDIDMSVARSKSEVKVRSMPSNIINANDTEENYADLEEVKEKLDEYFNAIPFVVGRSVSRTFNLGLSFQHAMSMLKRIHSAKEVKSVLSIGRLESVDSEPLYCRGGNINCEAMFSSDWTKEDEEAWEANPWDSELNKRRPKCTCLPNSCTTLKNVLKNLAIKNPGFNMRSLQPIDSLTTNKVFFFFLNF